MTRDLPAAAVQLDPVPVDRRLRADDGDRLPARAAGGARRARRDVSATPRTTTSTCACSTACGSTASTTPLVRFRYHADSKTARDPGLGQREALAGSPALGAQRPRRCLMRAARLAQAGFFSIVPPWPPGRLVTRAADSAYALRDRLRAASDWGEATMLRLMGSRGHRAGRHHVRRDHLGGHAAWSARRSSPRPSRRSSSGCSPRGGIPGEAALSHGAKRGRSTTFSRCSSCSEALVDVQLFTDEGAALPRRPLRAG